MFDLLADPLIRIGVGAGPPQSASLPEVYAALMRDDVDSFPALRPHQRHAWHAFLVQLGAMALHEAGRSEPPEDPAAWLRLIRGLTPNHPDDEPWRLVVDDITKPAFMQPPASSANRWADYKSAVTTPDELDLLVTSKNHDLKSAVAASVGIDAWIFALVSLQTCEGFAGAGNYGISRMNGGLGCRPAVSLTPSMRPGVHARRDIGALLERRESILDLDVTSENGIRLLWVRPWDGTKAEALGTPSLDPYYIEICRRIRLRAHRGGALGGVRATSKAARIEAKALKGLTGDPWTPVNQKDNKSLTLAAGGFTHRRIVDYLTPGDWGQSPLCKPTAAERANPRTMHLVARAMVRGQGKTEGYHERIVPLTKKVIGAFGRPHGADDLGKLGEIARARLEDAAKLQRILRHAVWTFAAGGKTEGVSEEVRSLAYPWANKLDERVDATFFADLQEEFEADDQSDRDQIRRAWLLRLIGGARGLLRQAEDALPCPAILRYRARVRADSVFEGRIRGNTGFPWLFDQEEQAE